MDMEPLGPRVVSLQRGVPMRRCAWCPSGPRITSILVSLSHHRSLLLAAAAHQEPAEVVRKLEPAASFDEGSEAARRGTAAGRGPG